MRQATISAMAIAKIGPVCLLVILSGVPLQAWAEGVWSGTITETVEFGISSSKGRSSSLTKGTSAALLTSSSDQDVFRDLLGERKLEIMIKSNNALASVLGKGSWHTDDSAMRDVSPCYETAMIYEHLDLLDVMPRGSAKFSVAIDSRGRYTISSSGTEKISYNGFRETRHVTMCDYKPQVWTGECFTAPPSWTMPCRSSYTGLAPNAENQRQYWERTGAQHWTRTWDFKASGSTCSPNHLVGSKSEEKTINSVSGLPAWFAQSMDRAAIKDKYGSRPGDLPFVMKTNVSWDLKREDPKPNSATGCSYRASGGQGIVIEGTICKGLGEPFTLNGRPPDGSHITFSFSPSGDSAGTLTYTGRGGPFTMAGKGSYSIKPGSGDTLVLTQTDSGCMTNVPLGGCSSHTNTVTLTPIPSCR